ncbi:MAG: branched-chain amino acid ABC transporter permease [Chloroflexota bacterium]
MVQEHIGRLLGTFHFRINPRALILGAIPAVLLLAAVPYLVGAYGVSLITEALILGVWAMSLNVLAGQTGLISLGHAATFGVGAYGVALTQNIMEWPFLTSALVGLVAALAVSLVFALTAARSTGVYFIIVTLAQGMLVWGVIQRWSSVTGGDDGLRGIKRPEFLAEYWDYYWATLAVVVASIVALGMLQFSRVGLRLRGVRDSATRMLALGYSVSRQRIIGFLISGTFAGLAGVLYVGHFLYISPSAVYVTRSVEVLLMVIIGGIGTFLGPMVGAAMVVFGRAGLSLYTERWATVMGVALILMVLFAPDGIVGRLRSLDYSRWKFWGRR